MQKGTTLRVLKGRVGLELSFALSSGGPEENRTPTSSMPWRHNTILLQALNYRLSIAK